MAYRILLAIFFVITLQAVFAQTDVENKLKLAMWTNPPAEFKTTEVPEKWKNESAVVLALEREYIGDFSNKMSGLTPTRFYVEKLNTHLRIKLLDKAAVVDYSDLSFDDKIVRTNMFGRASKYRVIGIKVIKPDGSGKEVDLSTAVKTDVTDDNELKIPIPNLEPGDIIDYYVAVKDESVQMPDFGDEIMLEGKYPIVSNTFRFSIPHQFDFKTFPQNGAPDFKKQVVKNDEIYELKISMQEKAPDLLWDYEYRTMPHIRYKIGSNVKSHNPKYDAEKMVESFGGIPMDIGIMEDFVKLSLKKEKDPKKLTREIFYLLRNPIYKKALFDIEQGDPLNTGYVPNKFFYYMDKFLTAHQIKHEVLLTSSRSYGPIPSIVNFSSCDLLIKVNTTPPIYISRPTPFAMPNDLPYLLEGTEAVSNLTKTSYRKIPETTAAENIETTTFTIAVVPDDITKLQVKRNVVAKGHNKAPNQYAVFTNYDYMMAYNLPKYQVQSSRLMGGIIKQYNKEKDKFEQRQAQDYNERDTRMKEELERDTEGKVSDYKLTVKSIGMWDEAPDTDYTDEFVLETMTKKAGPNMIVELGRFIGGQTAIKDEQLTRTRDVYMDYARTFALDITFTIPEGYELEGVENLNKKVETDAGGFVSTGAIVGNQLKVTTKKYYNKNQYTAAEWSKLTGFLAAAVEFQKVKVLLKKK